MGSERPHETLQLLDPRRAALLVVDLQNDYCHPEGALARKGLDVSGVDDVVVVAKALLARAADAGVPRIVVRTGHSAWFDTPAWRARGTSGDRVDVSELPVAEEGTWGAELYGIEPDDETLEVVKRRYSGFAYTDLELALRAQERDVAVIAGVTTNVCVEATAMDALMRGFHPVIVRDGVTTGSGQRGDEDALTKVERFVGSAVSSQAVLAAWGD